MHQARLRRGPGPVFALAALLLVAAATPAGAAAAQEDGGWTRFADPFAFVSLELALIVFMAAVGRWLALRLAQPAVVGELLVGMLLGNLGVWAGVRLFELIMHLHEARAVFERVWASGRPVAEAARQALPAAGDGGLRMVELLTGPDAAVYLLMGMAAWLFSKLGILLLLLMVGLESDVDEMRQAGPRAALVALLGIVAPFALGWGASMWLLPGLATPVHVFIAATLAATSVGITARVFRDLGRLQSPEAKITVGAAEIDDVLGLILLAVVVGIVATGAVHWLEIGRIAGLSLLFMGTVVLLGEPMLRRFGPIATSLDPQHGRLLFPLGLALFLAWVANLIDLAGIVGAFAAGVIIRDEHLVKDRNSDFTIRELISPLERLFAPIFFVLMGMQVNLASFLEPATVALALLLTAAAVIGKVVAGLPAGAGRDRLSIGIGMVPRGEVGLIFAGVGKGLGVLPEAVFSAVVLMVMLTTLVAPLGLKWSLERRGAGRDRSGPMA